MPTTHPSYADAVRAAVEALTVREVREFGPTEVHRELVRQGRPSQLDRVTNHLGLMAKEGEADRFGERVGRGLYRVQWRQLLEDTVCGGPDGGQPG